MDDTTKRAAQRMISVTEAWTKCARVNDFDYFIPVKEFAAGLYMAAENGAEDDLLSTLGTSLARAVRDGEEKVRIMVMQWRPACDLIYGQASAYCLVAGYFPEEQAAACQ